MTIEASSIPSPGLNRRQLLIAGAGAALAAGIGLSVTSSGRGLLGALPLLGHTTHPLDRTPMSDRIGERFATRDPDGNRVDLTLASVANLPAASSTSASAGNLEGQFVARFTGPRGTPLTQNTYRFSTSSFGDVDIFIVPERAGDDPDLAYSAVFNRLATEDTP